MLVRLSTMVEIPQQPIVCMIEANRDSADSAVDLRRCKRGKEEGRRREGGEEHSNQD